MEHDFQLAVFEGNETNSLVVTGQWKCKRCRLKITLPAAWSLQEQAEYLEVKDFGRTCKQPGGGSGQ